MKIYAVSELNALIKSALEGDPRFRSIALKGEISNYKTYPSGHAYFSLKDGESVINCAMWASYRAQMTFEPKNGDEVLLTGRINVYPPRGSYQFTAETMEMSGQGAALAKLRQLAEQLRKEGLFDESRKRPLPLYPKRIAVIAGKGSAGMKDIEVNLLKRWPLVEILSFPSLVQGASAPLELRNALSRAESENPEILIIGRGGGSSEDLSAFNDEALVRAIASFPAPVIAAVGHEVDVTLTDLVADHRASTPTGAAVLAVPDKNEVRQRLDGAYEELLDYIQSEIARLKERLSSVANRPFFLNPGSIYAQQKEKLSHLGHTLSEALMSKTRLAKEKGTNLSQRLRLAATHRLSQTQSELSSLKGRLEALSPESAFSRGYSYSEDQEGKAIASAKQLKPGDRMKTHFKDGIITSKVTGKE